MIDARDYITLAKGKSLRLDLDEKRHRLVILYNGNFNLLGMDTNGETHLLKVCQGSGRITETVQGFAALELVAKDKTTLNATYLQRDNSEEINHDEPPQPKEARNLLQKMRMEFRRNLGVSRESFLESDTALPGYELDPDDPDMFEEELAEMVAEPPAESPVEPPAEPPAEPPREPAE
jgi:hypothetical protein